MHRLITYVLALTLLAVIGAVTADGISWPDLSTVHAFKGRVATEEDVAAGRAAFAIPTTYKGRPISGIVVPYEMVLPQYAFVVDAKGQRTPVIVIQAEEITGTLPGKGRLIFVASRTLTEPYSYPFERLESYVFLGTLVPPQ